MDTATTKKKQGLLLHSVSMSGLCPRTTNTTKKATNYELCFRIFAITWRYDSLVVYRLMVLRSTFNHDHNMSISRLIFVADTLLQCSWIHTIFRGNFTNDLSDAVVYLCRFVTPLNFCLN
jgi:hypothetical protein